LILSIIFMVTCLRAIVYKPKITIMKNLFLNTILCITVIFIVTYCTTTGKKESLSSVNKAGVYDRTHSPSVPDFALELLIEGNRRFVNDSTVPDNLSKEKRKTLKEKGQKPFAIILTCSDSRVPPELIFDQGLGDLFVARVAGNVIDSVVMGSIEYAVEHLKVPLIMVLGHEKCGAVKATVEGGEVPGSIPAICNRIASIVNKVKKSHPNEKEIAETVADENVIENVAILETNKLLEHFINTGKLKIVGAKYYLETGEVKFINE
jgi:carbonic anhydrase